jgi:glycosyltransferase involved in cell wall biosynthesis
MITLAPLLLKRALRGARVVTHFSNLGVGAPRESRALRHRVRRWLFRRAGRWRYGALLPVSDHLVVLSGRQRETLSTIDARLLAKARLIPPAPLIRMVPPNETFRSSVRASVGVKPDGVLFAYFARLFPGKGIEVLLEAFRDVSRDLPDARLAMIGGYHSSDASFARTGYQAELEGLVRVLGLEDRVFWSGEYAWDSDEASAYLRAADVAVLPFDRGVSFLNSSFAAVAAHGLPIVATRAPAAEEPIQHGCNIFSVPPGDCEALAAALRRLHEDVQLRQRLGRGAQDLADQWFSWPSAMRTIVPLLI